MIERNIKNKIFNGNCVDILHERIPENYVDLVVTSPPYDNLRDYNHYVFDYYRVIKSLYKVLKPGGVVVWVVGDATVKGSETGTSLKQALAFMENGFLLHDTMIFEKNTSSFPARRNGKRYTQIFEFMFVFSKDKPPKTGSLICDKENKWAGWTNWGKKTDRGKDGKLREKDDIKPVPEYSPRNNIWKYVVSGHYGNKDKRAYKHPATFPIQLAEDHILSWSNEGDVVLDPMVGSGTTCIAAKKLNRDYIGIDISEEYCKLSEERLNF